MSTQKFWSQCSILEIKPTWKDKQGVCIDTTHKHKPCQGHTLVKALSLAVSSLKNKFRNVPNIPQLYLVREKIETDT